jgi:hypothetical protein
MDDSHGLTRTVARPLRRSDHVALGAPASRWLAALPQSLQPRETAARFPHIVNKLATLWQTPKACRAYFDDLLLDGRGDRTGFPGRVAQELVTLKYHYDAIVHPTAQNAWDDISKRPRA